MDSAQKTPLNRTLPQFVGRIVNGAQALQGRSWPAVVASVSGSIVTVSIDALRTGSDPWTVPQLTVPIVGSEYVRAPIQAGCKGVVIAMDAYIGAVSGLGGSTGDLTRRGNLSSLVFLPIGNSGFSPTDDANSVVIYGPDGAIIRTTDKSCTVTISSDGVTISVPTGKTVTVKNLPISAAGLTSGALWNNANVVNVIP